MNLNLDLYSNDVFNHEEVIETIICQVNYRDFAACSQVSKLMNKVTERVASLTKQYNFIYWNKYFGVHISEAEAAFYSKLSISVGVYYPAELFKFQRGDFCVNAEGIAL